MYKLLNKPMNKNAQKVSYQAFPSYLGTLRGYLGSTSGYLGSTSGYLGSTSSEFMIVFNIVTKTFAKGS